MTQVKPALASECYQVFLELGTVLKLWETCTVFYLVETCLLFYQLNLVKHFVIHYYEIPGNSFTRIFTIKTPELKVIAHRLTFIVRSYIIHALMYWKHITCADILTVIACEYPHLVHMNCKYIFGPLSLICMF